MHGMNRGGPRGFGGPGMGHGIGPGMGMHHGPMMGGPHMGMHRRYHGGMFGLMMTGGLFRCRRRGSLLGGVLPGILIGLLAYFFFF